MARIVYDPDKVIVKGRDQTVYFTLNDDVTDYEWLADLPLGVDIQKWLDGRADELLLAIRRREYFGPDDEIEINSLAEMDEWIASNTGAVKKPFPSMHPVKTNIIDGEKIDPTVWTDLDKVKGADANVDAVITALESIFGRT
jgi:hypothetical protein